MVAGQCNDLDVRSSPRAFEEGHLGGERDRRWPELWLAAVRTARSTDLACPESRLKRLGCCTLLLLASALVERASTALLYGVPEDRP